MTNNVTGLALLAAPTLLSNCSIVDAFQRCVLDDPEIRALAEPLIEESDRYSAVLVGGAFPGPWDDYKWPVNLTSEELANGFVRPFFYSPASKGPSDAIRQISSLIVDRWQALRGLLLTGKIVARGTFAKTGFFQEIQSMQWRRHDVYVDVKNGDFYATENYKPLVVWTGLALTCGAADDQVGSVDVRDVQNNTPIGSKKPRSVAQESIAEAVLALWPNGIPAGIPHKARDKQINDWQRYHGRKLASAKSIQRFFDTN